MMGKIGDILFFVPILAFLVFSILYLFYATHYVIVTVYGGHAFWAYFIMAMLVSFFIGLAIKGVEDYNRLKRLSSSRNIL